MDLAQSESLGKDPVRFLGLYLGVPQVCRRHRFSHPFLFPRCNFQSFLFIFSKSFGLDLKVVFRKPNQFGHERISRLVNYSPA